VTVFEEMIVTVMMINTVMIMINTLVMMMMIA